MKKSGFSMIELIFAIVIIGILAAVALPKLSNLGDGAKDAKMVEFVGQLNSAVAPQMWASKVNSGGSVATLDLKNFIDIPSDWSLSTTVLSGCKATLTDNDKAFTITIGGRTKEIFCRDGNSTTQPKFGFNKDLNTSLS